MELSFIVKALPLVLRGATMTVFLALSILALSTLWGFILAVIQVWGPRVFAWAAAIFIWLLTGVPGIIILFFCYFALPQFGIELLPLPAAVLGLTLQHGAYMAEVMRAGFESVHPGQFEAAKSLGLSFPRTVWRIAGPQAARAIVPPYVTQTTGIVKRTTLASVISVPETTLIAYGIMGTTYRALEIFTLVAVLFMLMNGALLVLQPYLERKYALKT